MFCIFKEVLKHIFFMSELAEKLIAENLKTKNPVLNLSYCNFNNIEKLAVCTHLNNLTLVGLEDYQDVSFLRNLKKLNSLSLRNSRVNNFEIIRQLTDLIALDLYNMNLQNISFLEDLEALKILNLSYNRITDISPLKRMKKLENLYLRNNQIRDITVLSNFRQLRILQINENQIQNIKALENLQKLEELVLYWNKIEDVSILENLKQLQILNLGGNPIREVGFLKNLEALKEIDNIDMSHLNYVPICYVYLQNKKGKLGNYTHFAELPEVAKIWQMMQNGDAENINLAHQLALSQGWTEEEFKMYRDLVV